MLSLLFVCYGLVTAEALTYNENLWMKNHELHETCAATGSYYANTEPLTFDQAVIFCRRHNMRLPVPLNEKSNWELASEIKKEIFLGIR